MLLYVHKDPKDGSGRGTQDVHLDFHTAPDLYRASHSLKLIKALTIKLVNMVINVHRNRKGRRGEGGMEVGGEGDYVPIAILSPPECFLH